MEILGGVAVFELFQTIGAVVLWVLMVCWERRGRARSAESST
jgi:hypothetical protein